MNHQEDCDCHEHDHAQHDHHSTGVHAYRAHGVCFKYPDQWTLTEEPGPQETTISVQSPGTSYWSLTLFHDRPEPSHVIETVLEAYSGEYKDLDVYEPSLLDFDVSSVARDLDFVCLDLVNSASLLSFQTADRTILVMFQGTDIELESTRYIMESMTRSLSCEEGLLNENE